MTEHRKPAGTTDGNLERAKDKALGMHDDHPGVADHVGEAAGGISGVLAGAAIGSVAGPIGTLVGGIAGAMGGWWTGRAIAEAATTITHTDDEHYRRHYEATPTRPADRRYEDVQPAYHLGHIASHNPNFESRTFDEVEPELRRGWTDDARSRHGEWESVRGYVNEGFTRGTSARGSSALGAGATAGAAAASGLRPEGDRTRDVGDRLHGAADRVGRAADDLKDRIDGDPATRPGADAPRGVEREGAIDRAADRTRDVGERLGNAVERGVDNVKDRVDGNPASKPGLDPTDRRF